MTAPERIWVDLDAMYPEQNGGFWWGEECRGIKYVRADLATPAALAVPEVKALVSKEAATAREVFEGYGSKAKEAIDYMEQLLLAALRGEGQP